MRLIPLSEVLKMEVKEIIPYTRGTIKAAYKPTKGESENGPWSVQNVEIEEGGTKIRCSIWNKDEVKSSDKGKVLHILSHRGEKGMSGVYVDENTYNGKTTKQIKVTQSAELTFVDPVADAPEVDNDDPFADPAPAKQAPAKQSPAPHNTTKPAPAKAPAEGNIGEIRRLTRGYFLCLTQMIHLREMHASINGEQMTPEMQQSFTTSLFIQGTKDDLFRSLSGEPFKDSTDGNEQGEA